MYVAKSVKKGLSPTYYIFGNLKRPSRCMVLYNNIVSEQDEIFYLGYPLTSWLDLLVCTGLTIDKIVRLWDIIAPSGRLHVIDDEIRRQLEL